MLQSLAIQGWLRACQTLAGSRRSSREAGLRRPDDLPRAAGLGVTLPRAPGCPPRRAARLGLPSGLGWGLALDFRPGRQSSVGPLGEAVARCAGSQGAAACLPAQGAALPASGNARAL